MKAHPIDEKQYLEKMKMDPESPHHLPSSPRKHVATGEYTVTRQYGKAKEPLELDESEDHSLKVRTFVTEPARVDVELGRSINMGNFSTARIYVRVSVPCYVEELEGAYAHAHDFARDRVEESVVKIRKYLDERQG